MNADKNIFILLVHNWLNNSADYSPSWKARSSLANQEIPHISSNPQVQFHVNNSLPPVHVMSHMNSVHALPSISLRSILLLASHLCLGLSNGLLASNFSTKYSTHSHLPCMSHKPCLSHPLWFDHSDNILVRSSNQEVPHYVILPMLLIFLTP